MKFSRFIEVSHLMFMPNIYTDTCRYRYIIHKPAALKSAKFKRSSS